MESNLSSPRTVESSSSSDSVVTESLGQLNWASPIITCVRNFKGGTLIANSAPFKDALIEAEKIWVEENIDYKTEEEKSRDTPHGRKHSSGLPRMDDDSFQTEHSRQNSFDEIKRLEFEVKRLTIENRELREQNQKQPEVELKGNQENVASMMGKIFETDWREAFEHFTKKKRMKDTEAIEELLRIAESCFFYCQKIAEDHLVTLKETFIVPCEDKGSLRKIQTPDSSRTPTDVIKKINLCRISTCHESFKVIKQLFFLSESLPSKHHPKNEKLTPFIVNCLSCAWLANIQDPPMHMLFRLKRGSPFYSNVMTTLHEPGPTVDFLIWPIVFLYEKGPLLLKGIVQCSDARPSSK